MPGSANFVGEFLILLGVFQSKLVISVIAFAGVVGAAVYALRVFIGAMHNRVGPQVASREIGIADLAALVPLVGVILVLAFYPQFVLKRTEPSATRVDRDGAGVDGGAIPRRPLAASSRLDSVRTADDRKPGYAMNFAATVSTQTHRIVGPHIDWAGMSPLVALTVGALVVLLSA